MHPTDCPDWEYDNYPNRSQILQKEIKSILIELRGRILDSLQFALDTRPLHLRMFYQLAPIDYKYYAGHYRGENFRCLKYNQVGIRSDSRVGFPPHQVQGFINELGKIVQETVTALDEGMEKPSAQIPSGDKILYIVIAVCRIFEFFLRIHPYVNGNGHTARFCMWALLGRYGLAPVDWPIEPRPDDPPYTNLIVEYRNGNQEPLERYILKTLFTI
jgi:fido (protein-threonine AMPylation protein)